jgi:hypothetical protein
MISITEFMVVAHALAYRRGRHQDVVRLTKQINAMRDLRPRRADDRRCDTQFDYDRERAHGWAAS